MQINYCDICKKKLKDNDCYSLIVKKNLVGKGGLAKCVFLADTCAKCLNKVIKVFKTK